MSEMLQENPSILVVEDDPGDLGLIKSYLRQAGLTGGANSVPLAWARSLAEGIAEARRSAPDVILLDLSLPDSLGLTTMRAMHDAVPDLPIVVLTGHDEKALALATVECGAQDYLVKGLFNHDVLGRVVRYAVVRGKLEQRLVQHQQHLEEMVKERTVELARALEAAEAASRAKSSFLSHMSHEIRTPMNGIMGMTSVLIRNATDPKLLERLNKIDNAAHHLLKILNNVLDMAKIEVGKMFLEARELDLAALLAEVHSLLESQASAKGLVMRVDCDPALPAQLLGDALRIKQVLINLASNAVKFTEQGDIRISVQLKALDDEAALLRFAVADSGIGIEPESRERIFHAFEQADNSSTRAYGGTGLGLAISRNLVNLMGGVMEIVSLPGRGSTFSFDVRLKLPPAARSKTPDTQRARGNTLSGARVLVAEDDLLNQEIIRDLLSSKGMKVDLAADGEKAVDLARFNPYDLILMDLHMPLMNGPEASLRIRQIPHHVKTPILALTADAFAETRDKCLDAGMNDHIGKPFDPDQLFATIENWLQVAASPPGIVDK